MPNSLPERDTAGSRSTSNLLKTASSGSLSEQSFAPSFSRGASAASLLRGSSSASLRQSSSGLSVLLSELQDKKKDADQDQSPRIPFEPSGHDQGATSNGASAAVGGTPQNGNNNSSSSINSGNKSIDVQKEERVVMTNYGADDVPLHRRAILQKIPREWVKCIASYTALEKRLSWLMLVHALWSDEKEFKLKINIPDTVLFHNGRILCWLFTSPRTGFLLRRNAESLFMDKIAKHMLSPCRNAHPTHHAAMYSMDRGDVLVKYPSKQQLQQYMNLRDKVDLVSMVSLQKSLKFEDTYITCYTARLVHFRDDVEDYRTATYSFKIHQGRRIFLQVRELSQKLGSMLRQVIGTLQHNIHCRFLYVEAVFSVDEFGEIYLTQLAQSLTRARLKQFQKDQESINPKAATGGHHGDVIRGMQTQRKGQLQKKNKKKKHVSRSLGSLMNRGAKALKTESDSLAMKRWIKYLNKNQGLHSESSRNLLGIKGSTTTSPHHTAALRHHRHRGLIVDEPVVPARNNSANGSSLMLGGHLNPIGQAAGQSSGDKSGGGGDADEGETKEEKHLLKQEKQTSAVQRLHSSKLVQRFRERLMPDGPAGGNVGATPAIGSNAAVPIVPGLSFGSSASIGSAVRGNLSANPNRASIGSMGGVRAAGIAAAAAGDKRDFLKIVEWDSVRGGSGGGGTRRRSSKGRTRGKDQGRRSLGAFGSANSNGHSAGGHMGLSQHGCPGLFCHSTRISDDSGQRKDELHMLPLRVIIAVLLDESFYTGVRLNDQTTMWECVVDYQNHRCLQEMLKPYSDAGSMYSREKSPMAGRRGGGGKVVSSPTKSGTSPYKAQANDRESYDILTALMKQIGGGAAMLQAAILDAQAATPHHPYIRMGQYDTAHQAAAMYDKCVDAEIEWLRIKYEQQREKAIEQALEQGLMLRGDNADEDMNSTVLDDDATTEAGFLQGIASQSKFHRGMDDESTFSSESEGDTPRMADFKSGGSRAWEEAGIAEDVRRFGAHAQDDDGASLAAPVDEANGPKTGLEPLPLHDSSQDTTLAASTRRRNKRREQFALNNSKFNNQFDGGDVVKMGSVAASRNTGSSSSPLRRSHGQSKRQGGGGLNKQPDDAYEDPFLRQERQQLELQKSYTKDQYMYMQNLHANSLRIRNYLPPSDPLYDRTAPKASADTICVLTQTRMKLWGNICSLVAPERAALRRTTLAESRLTREKHPGHWDTRLRQNLKEFQVTSANLYRTFCANLASRSYQMTKVCWKCYQGYQAIMKRTEVAEEEAHLAARQRAAEASRLEQHHRQASVLSGGTGGNKAASASGGGGEEKQGAGSREGSPSKDNNDGSKRDGGESKEAIDSPTSAALEARRKVEAVSKEFATRPEVLAMTAGGNRSVGRGGGGGVAADEFQDVISFLDTVAEKKKDTPRKRRVSRVGGSVGGGRSGGGSTNDGGKAKEKMTAERRGAQLSPYYLRSQFVGSFKDHHQALLKDLKKIKPEDHVVTPPGSTKHRNANNRLRTAASSKLSPLTRRRPATASSGSSGKPDDDQGVRRWS